LYGLCTHISAHFDGGTYTHPSNRPKFVLDAALCQSQGVLVIRASGDLPSHNHKRNRTAGGAPLLCSTV